MALKIGDVVAIRGDVRINTNGQCAYTPDQLVDGKYLKHNNGGIWTGVIEKIRNDIAFVGGGWRGVECLEVMFNSPTP